MESCDLITPDHIIEALRAGEYAVIRERFISLESLYAAYLSAITMDKLQGEERIDFMQLLGEG